MYRTKRLLLATVAAAAVLVVPGVDVAGAQACPRPPAVSPPCGPPPDVGGEGETPPEVEPDVVTPPGKTPPANQPVAVGGKTPEVLESVTPRSSGALPFTGGEIGAAGALGAVLIGAGVTFAVAGRRRRSQFDPAT